MPAAHQPEENPIALLIDQVQRAYDKGPWHGPSAMESLEGLDHLTASRRLTPDTHTIWEMVLHYTGWVDEVARRLREGWAGDPPKDWPAMPVPTESAWKATLDDLARAQAEVVRTLESLPATKLTELVSDERPHRSAPISKEATVLGLLQHYAYHTGQIVLLRKALENSAAR